MDPHELESEHDLADDPDIRRAGRDPDLADGLGEGVHEAGLGGGTGDLGGGGGVGGDRGGLDRDDVPDQDDAGDE